MEIRGTFLSVPSWDRWIVAESRALCGVRGFRVHAHVHDRDRVRGYDCDHGDGCARDQNSA